jgi:lysophospholipase L1-like esterase
MFLEPEDRVLFIGDSITDSGRNRENPLDLGHGYACLAAAHLQSRLAWPELRFLNRGISGNRVYDVEARIETDLMALEPTIVSILIGINDVWRRFDSGVVSEPHAFWQSYHRILTAIRDRVGSQIVILEPFVLPVPEDRRAWRDDLDVKIRIVRDLAVEFEADLVPLDGIFAEAATRAPAPYWLPDGVHPTLAGHGLIAEAWLDRVSVE